MESTGLRAPVPCSLFGRSCASRCSSSAGTSVSSVSCRLDPTFLLAMAGSPVVVWSPEVQPTCHSPRELMRFDLSDIVRVQQLTVPTREVDGPGADPPQPRVGELGVVVDLLGDDMYLVEHTTDD